MAVLPLHGHLAPLAWAAGQAHPGARIGFVQASGGGLPGALSRDVGALRERGLRLLYDEPRRGTAGSRINFIHPKDAGGILVELVEPAAR